MKSQSFPESIPAPFNASELLSNAYRKGWSHGHGIACHNAPKLGDKVHSESLGRVTVDADNIREVHEDACHSAAMSSRDFSPFEFIAHEFNSDEENSEELWEAFEQGTSDAIAADLSEYSDADYGLTSWGNPPAGFLDYRLPECWASYLINGDASGLDDAEQAQVDAWFDAYAGKLLSCCGCSEEKEFLTRNDAGTLAGDCLWFRFPIKGFRFPAQGGTK